MKCLRWLAVAGACLMALAVPARATPQAATQVDMAIALLVDASRSVTAEKFVLQRDGYVNLFSDEKLFLNFMREGRLQKVAVTLIYWSSPKKGYVAVDWTVIDSARSAQAFADAVKAAVPFNAKLEPGAKPFDGTTAPGSALAFALPAFKDAVLSSKRKVIVVSGDGIENDGLSTPKMRDEALKQGIEAIVTVPMGSVGLKNWFVQNLQAGEAGFTVAASDFPELGLALESALRRILLGESKELAKK
ncbi:DUF1194 domain-containing protein [Rhodoferax sp.]|uniref:DUF1194 domain-containing protein n=1 Tax=Rhodoferax sp. TaxID=50421 RepID=UPI0026351839|nr:DUF1194 domain-containing protein [Rhodoferax sp.]MDD3935977.1 DUF1194 domain-containing protein [Rhodoferax sp.]